MSEGCYYDADGFAVTLGYDRYGPTSPLRDALIEAANHLFAASLHMPSDWQCDTVRGWAEAAGRVAYAASAMSAGTAETRSGSGLQPASAGPQDIAQTPSPTGGNS
jgi:hypothetical protein